jgi:FixJ family two-component response regulator
VQTPSPWIAIVDDDAAVRKALARLLNGRGLRAQTYDSAQAFLAALPSGRPQCLIVDLQLPATSGPELLEHLSRSEIQIPTIVVTAQADVEARRRCRSYPGTVALLAKPVQDVDLFAAIQMASGIADDRDHKQ